MIMNSKHFTREEIAMLIGALMPNKVTIRIPETEEHEDEEYLGFDVSSKHLEMITCEKLRWANVLDIEFGGIFKETSTNKTVWERK